MHFFPFVSDKKKLKPLSIVGWFIELPFYIFDIIFVPEIYEMINVWIRKGVRPISSQEIDLARRFFNDAIDITNILVNTKLNKWVRNMARAFVSFNVINYNRYLPKEIFVHELVHIWQYQNFGSVYILRALQAQHSKDGYDYGGVEALYHAMLENKSFLDFNFEQQGEIFEDYSKLVLSGNNKLSPMEMASYEYFISEVRA